MLAQPKLLSWLEECSRVLVGKADGLARPGRGGRASPNRLLSPPRQATTSQLSCRNFSTAKQVAGFCSKRRPASEFSKFIMLAGLAGWAGWWGRVLGQGLQVQTMSRICIFEIHHAGWAGWLGWLVGVSPRPGVAGPHCTIQDAHIRGCFKG